jgi:UDP-glucuronate 4-epimerase
MKNKTVLVTGAAGFIGFHLTNKLIKEKFSVIGLDNINNYYDIDLKFARLEELGITKSKAKVYNKISKSVKFENEFNFINLNIEDRNNLPDLFANNKIDIVCHLAAQAGVRFSIINPEAYVDSNIVGFLNIIECCRNFKKPKFIYASSSSVYGNSENVPYSETQKVDKPISLYAASKKSNELIAYSYSHLFDIQTIGLRFFTVYGPWGRPDMAPFLFMDAILNKKKIKVFNKGDLFRDFTYVDDIINGVYLTIVNDVPGKNKIYNIGNGSPVNLLEFIKILEESVGVVSDKDFVGMQNGDVYKTWANTKALENDLGYKSLTNLKEGVSLFTKWYKNYYK